VGDRIRQKGDAGLPPDPKNKKKGGLPGDRKTEMKGGANGSLPRMTRKIRKESKHQASKRWLLERGGKKELQKPISQKKQPEKAGTTTPGPFDFSPRRFFRQGGGEVPEVECDDGGPREPKRGVERDALQMNRKKERPEMKERGNTVCSTSRTKIKNQNPKTQGIKQKRGTVIQAKLKLRRRSQGKKNNLSGSPKPDVCKDENRCW